MYHTYILRGVICWISVFMLGISGYCQQIRLQDIEIPGEREVTVLYQDQVGYIWVGTSNGLKRFDGLDWKSFDRPDSVLNVAVTSMCETQPGELWVGYEDGKIYYKINSELRPFEPEEGLPKVAITSIQVDNQKNIWFSTYGEGIYYYLDNRRLYNINAEDGLSDEDVYVMVRDTTGKMWAGTDRGINICWLEEGKKHISYLTAEHGLPDNIVRALESDEMGNIWIGMYEGGVGKYHIASKRYIPMLDDPSVNISPISALGVIGNQVWIGTEYGNIWQGTKYVTKLELRSSGTMIRDLMVDREGNLWIAGNGNHLYTALTRFVTYPLEEYNLRSLQCGSNNCIWLGTSEGILKFDKKKGKAEKYLEGLDINAISIHEDIRGDIWVGTLGKGLYWFDPVLEEVRHYTENEGLINNNVTNIEGDGEYIWFATLGGASRIKVNNNGSFNSFENFNRDNGLGIDYIYDIFIDSRKHIWFTTDGKGVNHFQDGMFFSHEELIDETVFSMVEDHKGILWAGTESGKIFQYRNNHWERFDNHTEPNKDAIRGIWVDNYDQLMLVYDQKLELIGPERTYHLTFGENTGFGQLNPDLNIWSKDTQGQIWFVCGNGLVQYQPLSSKYLIKPQVVVEEVSVYLTPADRNKLSNLRFNQNHLTFSFKGLWYSLEEQMEYKYRLMGYDLGWVTTKDHTATFPQLRPGDYVFEVKASLSNNNISSDVITVPVKIQPPFWLQRWFLILGSLIGILIVAGYIRYRERRIQEKQTWEKEKIEYQFDTLRNQINPHFLFNSFNTLVSVIEQNQDMAVQYVEQLSLFFRNILEYRNEDTISLRKELELLDNFIFLQKKRYGTWLEINYNIPDSCLESKIPPLTLQILLENAIKHNVMDQEHPLCINIYIVNHQLWIKNKIQLKRTQSHSTKIGLSNIKSRYRFLVNDPVEVVNVENEFIVKLPLIYHYAKSIDRRR